LNCNILDRIFKNDLYMGVPIATGAIKTMRTNVVGRGLMLKPTVNAEVKLFKIFCETWMVNNQK